MLILGVADSHSAREATAQQGLAVHAALAADAAPSLRTPALGGGPQRVSYSEEHRRALEMCRARDAGRDAHAVERTVYDNLLSHAKPADAVVARKWRADEYTLPVMPTDGTTLPPMHPAAVVLPQSRAKDPISAEPQRHRATPVTWVEGIRAWLSNRGKNDTYASPAPVPTTALKRVTQPHQSVARPLGNDGSAMLRKAPLPTGAARVATAPPSARAAYDTAFTFEPRTFRVSAGGYGAHSLSPAIPANQRVHIGKFGES